jgi:DNA-binding GntR family transcriptional regulator
MLGGIAVEETSKKSMEQLAYEKLKDAILRRMLAPGTQLVESTVSEKLNSSRTPIRNAIKRLASEGLINLIPNRGAFVIQPSKEEIIQAFDIRAELESSALKFAFGKITNEDIEELNSLVEKEASATRENDHKEYHAMNKAFHMFFARKSGNIFLIEFTEKIIDRINVYLQLYDEFYNVKLAEFEGVTDHTEIISLLQKKDMEGIDKMLRSHIAKSLRSLQIEKIVYKSIDDIFAAGAF